MAKRKYKITPAKTAKWIEEGRGQGRGLDYKPWLTIFDFPSRGKTSIPTGAIIPRLYQLFSSNEIAYFKCLEISQYIQQSTTITDIREQYPLLPLSETVAIAEKLGFKHPPQNGKDNIVLTTDFIITVLRDGDEIDLARTVKETRDLTQRSLKKLEIERVYWERRGVDWGIVTEVEIDSIFMTNAIDLWDDIAISEKPIDYEDIKFIATELSNDIVTTHKPLNKYCLAVDKRLGYENGTSLTVARYLIATGYWQIDWFLDFSTTNRIIVHTVKPLSILR